MKTFAIISLSLAALAAALTILGGIVLAFDQQLWHGKSFWNGK